MLPRMYRVHLEKAWRIVGARVIEEDSEMILAVTLARGVNSIIHDNIKMDGDAKRLAEFEAAVGDYGSLPELLDRRVGVVFDRFHGIVGYAPSFCPLTACWPTDRRL